MYQKPTLIRFDQVDHAQKLFFAEAFTLAHSTFEEWIASKFDWNFWFNNQEWAVPLVHAEADYRLPLIAGEKVTVELNSIKLGSSRIEVTTQIKKTDSVAVTVQTVHVFVGKKSGKKIDIPAEVRKTLETH